MNNALSPLPESEDLLYTRIEQLQDEVNNLKGILEAKNKELQEVEDSYDAIHNQYEQMDLETRTYRDNKKELDHLFVDMTEVKDFVMYVVEECEVKPQNEHVFRAFKHQVINLIKNLGV